MPCKPRLFLLGFLNTIAPMTPAETCHMLLAAGIPCPSHQKPNLKCHLPVSSHWKCSLQQRSGRSCSLGFTVFIFTHKCWAWFSRFLSSLLWQNLYTIKEASTVTSALADHRLGWFLVTDGYYRAAWQSQKSEGDQGKRPRWNSQTFSRTPWGKAVISTPCNVVYLLLFPFAPCPYGCSVYPERTFMLQS